MTPSAAPPPTPKPPDPFEGHVFVVVTGTDDIEVLASTDGLRRVATYMTVDPSITSWVAEVVALPAATADAALRVMAADFDVATSKYNALSDAHTAAKTQCGFP